MDSWIFIYFIIWILSKTFKNFCCSDYTGFGHWKFFQVVFAHCSWIMCLFFKPIFKRMYCKYMLPVYGLSFFTLLYLINKIS